MNRLDHIIDLANGLAREATLARMGLTFARMENDEHVRMPYGTSNHVKGAWHYMQKIADEAADGDSTWSDLIELEVS